MSQSTMIHPDAASAAQLSPFVSGGPLPEPFTIVIFGATGDLAARKLLPALYALWHGRFLPEQFAIVGRHADRGTRVRDF